MPNCSGQSTAMFNTWYKYDIYESFIADWDTFRSASIPIDVCLP